MKKKRQGCHQRLYALMTAIVLAATCFAFPSTLQVSAKTSMEDVLETYNSKTDVAAMIYPDREAKEMSFVGMEYNNESYNLSFQAKYEENEQVTYEGLRFVVANAQEVVKGRNVEIHLNVRENNLYIWARPTNGEKETGIFFGNGLLKGEKGKTNQYAIRYDNGKIWFFENDEIILDGFDLAGDALQGDLERYCNVEPKILLTNEKCDKVWYSKLRLWGKDVKYTGAFPSIPKGNGDYGTTVEIKPIKGSAAELEDGVLKNTEICTDLVQFKRLPFEADDTYAWSFDLKVEAVKEAWDGVRPIIRANKDFTEYYQLLFLEGSVILNYRNDSTKTTKTVATANYKRTLGVNDKIGMVVSPNALSLWINNAMVMENVVLEHQLPANIAMKYEYAKANIKNLSFFYTQKVPYVVPEGDPTIPKLTKDMYNAAQYMVVKGADGPVGYQNYKLKSDELHYEFSNIPITEYGEYVFRADVTQHSAWTESWKGTRLKFRTGDSGDYYIYFLQDGIMIAGLKDQKYPIPIEVGKTYDIAIYSTASTVTVWLDGKCIFDKIDLSATGGKTRPAPGIWFEKCDAVVENMKIYGKDIVFTDETFDVQLKNNKWFNITEVPKMPNDGTNYFQNVKFGSKTNKDILPTYQDGIFKNEYSEISAPVYFVDQKDSNNINGLKNSATYVWSAKVKANSFHPSYKDEKGEVVKDVGLGFIFKRTTHPGSGKEHFIGLYLLQNRMELQTYRESTMEKFYKDNEFQLKEGQEYQVDMLIGSNWAKVWVDNRLVFTTYDLPTYNVSFQLQIINAQMEVSDIKVYTVESSTADIREATVEKTAVKAGNTIKDMKDSVLPLVVDSWRPMVAIALFCVPVVGLVTYAVVKSNKTRKAETKNSSLKNEKEAE